LILGLELIASKRNFFAKDHIQIVPIGPFKSLGIFLSPPPFSFHSPHLPLFNSAIMGEGKEVTIKPSLFQVISHALCFVYPCIAFFIFRFQGLFLACILWFSIIIGLSFRGWIDG